MDAKKYSNSLFGRVVDFDVVSQDHVEYAKVFASGSPELEKNLLTLWDYGFETLACGNGYDERMENFSIEAEQNIQSRYDTYLNASGLQKLLMKKEDYIPKYHGYVAIDAASVNNPVLFQKIVEKQLKPFRKDLSFSVEQRQTDGKPSVTIFLAVERNKPSTYKEMCLDSIEPEKALKMSLPEKTTFDKYFSAITSAVEQYCQKTGQKKGSLERMEAKAKRIKEMQNLSSKTMLSNKKPSEKSSLDSLIKGAKTVLASRTPNVPIRNTQQGLGSASRDR